MRRICFDMSSVIWRSLLAAGDPEAYEVEHEGRRVKVNTANWGYENAVNSMVKGFKQTGLTPIHGILVFEGMNSKARRKLIDQTYKETRDSRPPEAYTEFAKLRERLETLFYGLGACSATQALAEGDDTLAWLAANTRSPLTIFTWDHDLAALNGKNEHGAVIEVLIDGDVGINKFGLFDHHLITVYKALVGDSSDNIKGCPNFGPKAFEEFCAAYGFDGLQELYDMLSNGRFSPELHEMANEMKGTEKNPKPVHPLIRKLCDQEEQVVRCFKLAKMHPEWVNTMDHPIQWKPGVVLEAPPQADERVKHWYQQKVLVTAENCGEVLGSCLPQLTKSPFVAFDIETSSADESDEWLAAQGDPDGVDQMGSTLTGFSFTFGANMHRTVYVSVDHARTNNIRMSQARHFIEQMTSVVPLDVVIHNNHFELPVLYCAEDEDGTLWRDHWRDNGFHGFLPRSLDTKLEASYVNENERLGLKHRSMLHLGYKQTEYDDVTTLVGKALPPGGRELGEREVVLVPAVIGRRLIEDGDDGASEEYEIEPAVTELQEVRRYKMNELPATHVFDYGCDDTICTAGQHVWYRLIMEIEGTWDIYREVEIDASYQHAKNFVDGLSFSLQTCKELEKADDAVYEMAWGNLRTYLIGKGWDGTVCPTYDADIKVSDVKVAFTICFPGCELDTAVRSIAKVVKMLRDEADGDEDVLMFAECVEACAAGRPMNLNALVERHFRPNPTLNLDSPLQLQRLLYDPKFFNLPIQIRNKATPKMKAAGQPGSPKTDELAIRYSMRVASPEVKELLDSLWLVRMVSTRRELFYGPYPYFVHWKTGRIHPTHNQCGTNTRRASESKPNKQQLPKHPKVELASITDADAKASIVPRFREAIIPHRPDAVIVSMDFSAQELRVIADYSRDPNLVACYVGDNKKDMHALTGSAVLQRKEPDTDWSYEAFMEVLTQPDNLGYKKVKEHRAMGKKINFTTEYGAMAPKLAATMLVSEDEAQVFIDAREAMFEKVAEWKDGVIEEAKANGFVSTKLGARRHLRDALKSDNFMDASKAERQAVNTKVQGSCAEMTKLAEGRMWQRALFFRYQAVCYGPVHDECVASVVVDDKFYDFLREMHECMVAPYADMEIPIVSSISFGSSFGKQIEIGELPTKEAIDKGLAELRGEKEAVAA